MAVLILHPTEELIFTKLQKELISELFEDGRILVAAKPLWIHWLNDTTFGLLNNRNISKVELGDFEFSEFSIYVPVTITIDSEQYSSKLTLVNLHNGRQFNDIDRQIISKIKQPVRHLKVFRLGIEKELSSVSKCITESKWIKIK